MTKGILAQALRRLTPRNLDLNRRCCWRWSSQKRALCARRQFQTLSAAELPPVFEEREGLRLLSNEQRESLTLAYCDGLSHAQIASRLGQPVGTVKSWLRRAHEVLRAALSAHR